MKKSLRISTFVLALLLAIGATGALFASCGQKGIVIAVPNDTTNEARALLLLQDKGYIKLKEGAGITATVRDITENPYNITFREIEAAQLPNALKDVDYAVINSNYAISAKLNPTKDSLLIEGSSSAYANILAVKSGNEGSDKIKALVAALSSQKVADYIKSNYDGGVISVVDNPGDGFDSSVDYEALKGTTVSVAASPTPHAEILKVAAEILKKKDITLKIVEYTDYVVPNEVVESGEVDANYFQHKPYLDDFNQNKGTHIVSVLAVHVEPMGLYGGKQTSLDALKK
ncbi:d-methionine ABC superfamily ATP binding cassette transporter binding protein [Clostridium sp. CAG:448]|nr:d-methionine ABC superfamily ATP binding cassette transporter binding protein [Clostridium sp. CAG:448]